MGQKPKELLFVVKDPLSRELVELMTPTSFSNIPTAIRLRYCQLTITMAHAEGRLPTAAATSHNP